MIRITMHRPSGTLMVKLNHISWGLLLALSVSTGGCDSSPTSSQGDGRLDTQSPSPQDQDPSRGDMRGPLDRSVEGERGIPQGRDQGRGEAPALEPLDSRGQPAHARLEERPPEPGCLPWAALDGRVLDLERGGHGSDPWLRGLEGLGTRWVCVLELRRCGCARPVRTARPVGGTARRCGQSSGRARAPHGP